MSKRTFMQAFITALFVLSTSLVGVGCADTEGELGTQFAALTDESRSACTERCAEAGWPAERCEQACVEQRQDPCYEDCRAADKTGEECREECAEPREEGEGASAMSDEEMAAYEACEAECIESGKDAIECREECSP
jgi:hypothetical protein